MEAPLFGSIERQTQEFAQRIENLLTGVLGEPTGAYVAQPEYKYQRFGRIAYVIKQKSPHGILLRSFGTPILRLSLEFQCSGVEEHSWLRIEKSSILLATDEGHEILFHYDFIRDTRSQIPSAHINVNGSNDAATRLLLLCGTGKRGKSRRKDYLDKGEYPTFSTLHLPVGGDRFRPGLEDVLQLAAYEFQIDTRDGWQDVIESSREEYRKRQLGALVHEFPDIAFETLKDDGYVTGSAPSRPDKDRNRLRKY